MEKALELGKEYLFAGYKWVPVLTGKLGIMRRIFIIWQKHFL